MTSLADELKQLELDNRILVNVMIETISLISHDPERAKSLLLDTLLKVKTDR